MKLVKSARKEYRCDECGRRVPRGARYWRHHEELGDPENKTVHTNCLDFEKEPVLPVGFNQNRTTK